MTTTATTTVIARFVSLPSDAPTVQYAVSFLVTHDASGRETLQTAVVPVADLGDTYTDATVTAAAYAKVKSAIDAWVATVNDSPLVGTVFTP